MGKKLGWALCAMVCICASIWAADWPSTGGNPQRDGWAQGETVISKDSIAAKNFEFLYKYKFENEAKGLQSMSQPIVLTTIIGWKGFKQLVFVGGSSDMVGSFDANTGDSYFNTKFDVNGKAASGSSTAACSTGMTAGVVMPGSSAPGRGFGPAPAAPSIPAGLKLAPGMLPPAPPSGGGGFGGFGRGGPAVLWAVSSDGSLRTLRQQDGDAKYIAPTQFLPAGSNISGLNVNNNIIYAATVNGCSGNPNGLYAALYTAPTLPSMPGEPIVKPAAFNVVKFQTNGSGFSGSGGTAIGKDGTVYGQIAEGHGDVAGNYNDTVVALDPKTLKVKDYFTPSSKLSELRKGVEAPSVTPVVFPWYGKDTIAAGGRDGRIYLLDAASLGGSDHHTPLYVSDPVVTPDANFGGNGIWNSFATYTDDATGGTRWLYASVRGPVAMKFPGANGTATTGAIVAFKFDENGKKQPVLTPVWVSRDMMSPAAPAMANGLVFALSTGLSPRIAKADGTPYTVAEVEKMAKPAVLYVLDGNTGKELYSSGTTATTFAHSGIAIANGRVFFSTHDNVLYAYGAPEVR